jgi:riboflavin kinase/FMN adenylyltransferase
MRLQGKTGKNILELSSLDELHKHGFEIVSAAIGVFDGVHLGHRHLLNTLMKDAAKFGARPVALTFFPHPRKIICPEQEFGLLLPHEQKVRLLHEAGMDAVVTIPFTSEFSKLTPEDFLNAFLSPERMRLCSVCVGSKWKFGQDGSGSVGAIAKFAKNNEFFIRTVNELKMDGAIVSSTAIRRAVAGGDLVLAEKMLGRPYSIFGKVAKGLSFASNTLGFPTANLDIKSGILPPEGVYSGIAVLPDKEYKAAISIGTAPSAPREKKRELLVEAHILDFSGILYGKELEIRFGRYIREQRFFSNIKILREQIANDVENIRAKNTK